MSNQLRSMPTGIFPGLPRYLLRYQIRKHSTFLASRTTGTIVYRSQGEASEVCNLFPLDAGLAGRYAWPDPDNSAPAPTSAIVLLLLAST